MKNIEKMMKFCSEVSEIIGNPFFFNWSPPTNHRDNTPDGDIEDVSYVMLRLGMYPPMEIEVIDGIEYEIGCQEPIEKMLFFGHVNRITDFIPFNMLLLKDETDVKVVDYPIKSFEDLDAHKDKLIELFTESILKPTVDKDGPEL